ncbi:hypothetical protein GobsT_69950 [Gemmata obscuriglobus]|uniref:Uncharacterized protein n=1 Tax=Gemmata obscuriglobus TaxID=114 RepID=A0A2Z3HJ77_9BACT|nr:hypothetical protein [Gemmata obscuriglobus]AWM41884.1 hypothetical protein C1280_36095 [Gemmata obscuriglobus]QEG32143.1 hypothetical protein GobsT_69950 [Gemmata obscuriglobus]VTS11496.1 unnamed protein product [Gemmata obscuriglobus UQM 2246]
MSAGPGSRCAAVLFGTILLGTAGGCGSEPPPPPPVPTTPPAPPKPRSAGPDAYLEEFGQEHLPQVEAALDELKREIDKRSAGLAELEKELRRLHRGEGKTEWANGKHVSTFVTKDETHARWKATIEKLAKNVDALKEQRKEAYLAYRKFQIAQGTGEGLHKKRFDEANAAAAASQKVYQEALRDFEGR